MKSSPEQKSVHSTPSLWGFMSWRSLAHCQSVRKNRAWPAVAGQAAGLSGLSRRMQAKYCVIVLFFVFNKFVRNPFTRAFTMSPPPHARDTKHSREPAPIPAMKHSGANCMRTPWATPVLCLLPQNSVVLAARVAVACCVPRSQTFHQNVALVRIPHYIYIGEVGLLDGLETYFSDIPQHPHSYRLAG